MRLRLSVSFVEMRQVPSQLAVFSALLLVVSPVTAVVTAEGKPGDGSEGRARTTVFIGCGQGVVSHFVFVPGDATDALQFGAGVTSLWGTGSFGCRTSPKNGYLTADPPSPDPSERSFAILHGSLTI